MTYKAICLVKTDGRVESMHSGYTTREAKVVDWIEITLNRIQESISKWM